MKGRMSLAIPPSPGRKIALLTGATGFVGSHLVPHLLKDGWAVAAIVRPGSDPALRVSGVDWRVHDGTTQNLIDIVGSVKPDLVFHLASLFIAEHASKDIEPLVESNIRFGAQLAEAMSVQGVQYLVNTGTQWQHFHGRPYLPVNLYAAMKQAFEDILSYYADAKGLRVINLKLYDSYGPNDRRPKLFAALRKAETQALALSKGGQKLDLVYVDDTVGAFVLAAKRLVSGKVRGMESYAVSSGKTVTLRQLILLYERATGRRLMVSWGAKPYREREVMMPWKAGKRLPGWRPKVKLEEGLGRLE